MQPIYTYKLILQKKRIRLLSKIFLFYLLFVSTNDNYCYFTCGHLIWLYNISTEFCVGGRRGNNLSWTLGSPIISITYQLISGYFWSADYISNVDFFPCRKCRIYLYFSTYCRCALLFRLYSLKKCGFFFLSRYFTLLSNL